MIILQTFDGKNYEITEDQITKIHELSTGSKVNGIWIGKDYIAFASIKEISEIANKIDYPKLPPKGFNEIIKSANKKSYLEALLRGLEKAKRRFNDSTPKLDKLIQMVKSKLTEEKKENDLLPV